MEPVYGCSENSSAATLLSRTDSRNELFRINLLITLHHALSICKPVWAILLFLSRSKLPMKMYSNLRSKNALIKQVLYKSPSIFLYKSNLRNVQNSYYIFLLRFYLIRSENNVGVKSSFLNFTLWKFAKNTRLLLHHSPKSKLNKTGCVSDSSILRSTN